MNKKTGEPAAPLLVVMHAARAAELAIESKLSGIGLSMPKLMALKALAEAGESLPLGQLAERLSCVKSNVTQLVDRLEADGLVARQLDSHDRRTKLAVLTGAGRQACRDGTRLQEDAERTVLSRLTRDEARTLEALASKIAGGGR
jgi:DNA-binding MarR family transcriptional regulator